MMYEYGFELDEDEASINVEQNFMEAMMQHDEAHKSTESILLSIFDADDVTKKDIVRARNRASAKQARDADKLFIQLMLEELKEILETFDLYATYTAHLRMHVSHDAEGMHAFERRHMAHKANVARFLDNDCSEEPPACDLHHATGTIKERNRLHAQKSRRKRSHYIQNLVKERDESFLTLEKIVRYTTALESSCSFLNDLNEYVSADMMEMRQKLFDRTCAHQDKFPQLQSHSTFRTTYRVNFK